MRRKRKKVPFAQVVILVILLIGLAGGGRIAWQRHSNEVALHNSGNIDLGYNSPSISTPQAPPVYSTAGLSQAMDTLDSTDITASATDNAQLGLQAASF